ncbi:hypothetical protein L1987_33819 [Smallanthus sonchifolius]|uniref:Uncharacterized protein n=1 Tax=Smallanthus sonchifolius TaxID=185202 RepID=A0ACB9HSI1_9ASTR|nr:hypothetical protein L1987_33819 [Smallanthus sonchifolius]
MPQAATATPAAAVAMAVPAPMELPPDLLFCCRVSSSSSVPFGLAVLSEAPMKRMPWVPVCCLGLASKLL